MNLVLCARLPTNGWQIRTAYLPVTGKMYEELAANEVGLDISGCSYVNPADKSSPRRARTTLAGSAITDPARRLAMHTSISSRYMPWISHST